MKRIYVIWGGLLGWDGIITSRGLATLEDRLRTYGPVKSYLQASSYRCAKDIYNECATDDICILIAHSGGSVMATRICVSPLEKQNQRVDLLINIDGSPKGNMMPVGHNVKEILNIYNPSANWPGGGVAIGAERVTNARFNLNHLAFQFNEEVRELICKKVEAC